MEEKNVRDTSIEAYRKIKGDGLLSQRRLEIYIWLYWNGPATGNEIFRGIRGSSTINQANIPARLNEMREMEVVEERGTDKCSVTGMNVIVWDVTSNLPKPIEKPEKDQLQEWWIGPNGIAYPMRDIALRAGIPDKLIKHAKEVRP